MDQNERLLLVLKLKQAMTYNQAASFEQLMGELASERDVKDVFERMTWSGSGSNKDDERQVKEIKKRLKYAESWLAWSTGTLTWVDVAFCSVGGAPFFKAICEKGALSHCGAHELRSLFGQALKMGREDMALHMLAASDSPLLIGYVDSGDRSKNQGAVREFGSLGLAAEMGLPRVCMGLAERHAQASLSSGELRGLGRGRMQEALRSCREAMAHEGPPQEGTVSRDPEALWSAVKSGTPEEIEAIMDEVGPMRLCGFVIRSTMLSVYKQMEPSEAKAQAWAEMSAGPGAGISVDAGAFNSMLRQATKRITELEAKVAMMAAPRRALLGQDGEDGEDVADAPRRPAPQGPRG